jgi:pyruvate dehydrogenase kinase 2/3/4
MVFLTVLRKFKRPGKEVGVLVRVLDNHYQQRCPFSSPAKQGYLEEYKLKSPTPIALRDMLKWQKIQSTATSKLLALELMIRTANRIRELESFPTPFLNTKYTQRVLSLYLSFFHNLVSIYHGNEFSKEKAKWNEESFQQCIETFKDDDSTTVPTLARGMRQALNAYVERNEQNKNIQELEYLPNDFELDQFYQSRLGIRMLIGQRIKPRIRNGIDVVKIARKSYERAKQLSIDHYGMAPEIELLGHVLEDDWDVSDGFGGFCYVPSHLEHILFELIKNSMRATIEQYQDGVYAKNYSGYDIKENDMPSVQIIISKGDYDVSIKVSDEGGGVKRRLMPEIWSYKYSTAPYKVAPAPNTVMTPHSLEDDAEFVTFRQNFFGGGFGLPIARVFARYFGGDLKMISVEGFGMDAFVYIPHLGHSKEVRP